MKDETLRFSNPYVMGIALGLVLLTSLVVMGRGLGASGASWRIGVTALDMVAHEHVLDNAKMAPLVESKDHPLHSFYVFMAVGVFLGGAVSSFAAGRMGHSIVKGPRVSWQARLGFALAGGVIMGVAARLARGCTSGQALTGGALLSVGAWVFMLSVFAGGYALAYFVRREWI